MRYIFSLFFAAALVAPAQIVSFGVKAGVPLRQASPNHFGDGEIRTGRWTVGPTVEVQLIRRLSVEADALYHNYSSNLSYTFTDPDLGFLFASIRADTKAWDLPLLLKYRFLSGTLRPFVSGGYAFSYESNDIAISLTCGESRCNESTKYPTLQQPLNLSDSRFRRGPTAGAGIEYRLGRVKIAPEIRYMRVNNPKIDQVTLMVGFTF